MDLKKAVYHKTRTERVERAIESVLEGEDVSKLVASLSIEDQALLEEAIKILREDPDVTDAYLDDLWRLDYTRRPPSMLEFVDDPYWLGQITKKSEESEGMFPTWREILIRDFDLDSKIHNLVVTGSLGIGKTWVSCIILLYRITLARLLRNPQAFFGLSKGSAIFYATLSVTKSVVQETAFGDFMNFMGSSPFFTEECLFNPDKKYAALRIPVGNNIYLTAGSQGWHIIGRNAMGVILDEGNFRREANPDMKAYALYDEVRTRIRNRFQKVAGFLPAISILSSSARDESSFTEKVVTDIENSTDLQQKVYRYPVYIIKRHVLDVDKDRWFRVCYGLKNVDPYILRGWYTYKQELIPGPDEPEVVPSGAKVEYVPERYLSDYRRNIKIGLQSVSGISTGGSFRWFTSTIDLELAVTVGKESGVVNPCKMASIPISEEDDKQVWDYLDHTSFLAKRMSTIIPKRNPDAWRFIHIDLALTSQAGLAVSHIVGSQKVEGLVGLEGDSAGQIYNEMRFVVEYDFILSIVSGKLKPISIGKVIKFVWWLKHICNYKIALVTADQFQSTFPLQMLEKDGFKVGNLSVDKTFKPYEAWRSAFEERRIRLMEHSQLLTEAEFLVNTGLKVDHDQNHSKDLCDAACGSYFSSVTFKDDNITRSAHGAQPGIYSGLVTGEAAEEKPPISVVNLENLRMPSKKFDA